MIIGETNMTPGAAEFPFDQWYVAAFSYEIAATPLARTLLGIPVVLYRTPDGAVVAMLDRCPHRGMPLSTGKVVEDRLRCPYHGLEFAPSGRCARMPNDEKIPSAMKVETYPTIERWELIWIWLGDPQRADPAMIPCHDDLGLTAPGFYSEAGVHVTTTANYLLVFENYADGAHIPQLHGIGADNNDYTWEHSDQRVRVTRWYEENVEPWHRKLFGLEWSDRRIRRSLEHISYPPVVVSARAELIDLSGREPLVDFSQMLFLTPLNSGITHVFACVAGNVPVHQPDRWPGWEAGMRRADFEILEEMQRLFDSLPPSKRREVSVRFDEPALYSRHIIAGKIAAERRKDAEKSRPHGQGSARKDVPSSWRQQVDNEQR